VRRLVHPLEIILVLGLTVGLAGSAARQPTQGPQQGSRAADARQEQPAQEGKESLWRPSTYEPITFFTGALVLLTGVLAVVSLIQIRFLIRADEAARISANAAKSSAQTAEQSLIKLQRPFVFVQDFPWLWHPDSSRPGNFFYSIRPVIKNSGNTHTINMRAYIEYSLRDDEIPLNFDFPLTGEKVPTLIAPQGTISGAIGFISDYDLASVQRLEKQFYIWGVMEYGDIFGRAEPYVTKFCCRIFNVGGDPFNPLPTEHVKGSGVAFFFEITAQNNSAT